MLYLQKKKKQSASSRENSRTTEYIRATESCDTPSQRLKNGTFTGYRAVSSWFPLFAFH